MKVTDSQNLSQIMKIEKYAVCNKLKQLSVHLFNITDY